MRSPEQPIVVIGAGLSGLSAAYTLHQHLHQKRVSVQVLEAGPTVGGVIQTQHHETNAGVFQIEAGPHTYLSTAQALSGVVDSLGLSPQAANPSAKTRWIGRTTAHGLLLDPLPHGPLSALTTPVLSLGGKLRVLGDLFQPCHPHAHTASVRDWITHRFGAEVCDHLVAPFLTGVYAGDPDQQQAAAIFKKLVDLETQYGSVLRGVLSGGLRSPQDAGAPARKKGPYQLLSFSDGMQALPQALAKALGDRVHCHTCVTQLTPHPEGGWTITTQNTRSETTTQHAAAIVMATPSGVAAQLLAPCLPPSAIEQLRDLPYAPIAVPHLGFSRQALLNTGLTETRLTELLAGFGFLTRKPQPQGTGNWPYRILGSIYVSSLFPDRAPTEHILLSCFIGGMRFPDDAHQEDTALIQHAVKDLAAFWQCPNPLPAPVFSSVVRWLQAIPQFVIDPKTGLTHTARINALNEGLATFAANCPQSPLALAGNYYSGVSVNDCVRSGQTAANTLLAAMSLV